MRDLLALDEAGFRERFKGTPIKRAGRDCFIRNVLIACGNSGDIALVENIIPLLEDEAPVVRAMAVWALGELMARDEFVSLKRAYEKQETDVNVKREWREI